MPMDLETIADNARFSLDQALRIIKHGGVAERSGKAYGAASLMYHRLALCELLSEARADRFQVHLCKSALVRLHLVRLVSSGRSFHPSTTCAGANFSFVDAVVAGQLGLAADIARLTTDKHEPTAEYEDDFLLHRFLQRNFLHLHAAESYDFTALFDRWERVLEGERTPYFDVCQALFRRDAAGFGDALLTVIEERARSFQQKDEHSEEARRTDGAVFMNGLALLRMAEMSGLPAQREYPNIPSLARLPPGTMQLSPNAWMNPDEGLPG
ncbi:immunity 49 family protein [Archangium violaceum]|uniref:Imm49 family immunity protein n=1 Tax=Archangium violaceum TaxID=83451 RepID=UPI00193C183A|nr:Imm49 family immunity protein [Archangium violaceum]QRK04197.1 immunity 49 family protein [Archangium violaceum]